MRLLKKLKNSKVRAGYLFIFPSLLVILTFSIYPMINTFIFSFFRYDAMEIKKFIGLSNYNELFNDPLIWNSLRVTIYYVVGSLPAAIFISMAIALIINENWFKFRNFFTTIYFLPVVISMVAAAFAWRWFLNPMFGLANSLLEMIGLPAQEWLGNPKIAMISVILVSIWKNLGFFLIIYIAALQGIPDVYYEAAKIDGASKWHQIRYIVWPLLAPTTLFISVMGIIGGFQVFDQVFILTGGGPVNATRVTVYYIWQSAFSQFRMGYASSIATILFLLILGITWAQWKYYLSQIEL